MENDEKFKLTADDLNDIEEVIRNSPVNPHNVMDEEELARYNKRREDLAKFKQDLEFAEKMSHEHGNEEWAKTVIKANTMKMLIAQKIAIDDIEETGDTRRLTSISELSNAITNSAKTVVDIENAKETLKLSREKLDIRRQELDLKEGPVVDMQNGLGIGSPTDLLKALDMDKEFKKDEKDEV